MTKRSRQVHKPHKVKGFRYRTEPPEGVEGSQQEWETNWKGPHPDSVLAMAVTAMQSAGNKILATALKRLAIAEANGLFGEGDSRMDERDVLVWLDDMKADIDWLKHHIEFHLDLQRDIPRLVPSARQCSYVECDRWYIPGSASQRYCCVAHREAQRRIRTNQTRADTSRQCDWCGKWFVPKRSTAKYHSTACKQAAYRERRYGKDT